MENENNLSVSKPDVKPEKIVLDFLNQESVNEFLKGGENAKETAENLVNGMLGGLEMSGIKTAGIKSAGAAKSSSAAMGMASSLAKAGLGSLNASQKFIMGSAITVFIYVVISGVIFNISMFVEKPISLAVAGIVALTVFGINKILKTGNTKK